MKLIPKVTFWPATWDHWNFGFGFGKRGSSCWITLDIGPYGIDFEWEW